MSLLVWITFAIIHIMQNGMCIHCRCRCRFSFFGSFFVRFIWWLPQFVRASIDKKLIYCPNINALEIEHLAHIFYHFSFHFIFANHSTLQNYMLERSNYTSAQQHCQGGQTSPHFKLDSQWMHFMPLFVHVHISYSQSSNLMECTYFSMFPLAPVPYVSNWLVSLCH